MLTADFDERLGLITCEEGDCSASRPKHDPPCRVAVDGHIDGYKNERGVDEPGAGAEKRLEEKGVSSKAPRNMDEVEWLLRNTQSAPNRIRQTSCATCTLGKCACAPRDKCTRCSVLFTWHKGASKLATSGRVHT